MAINADTLLDRLYLKGQISKWRILAIVFAVVALLAGFGQVYKHSPIENEFIARLTFDGFIGDDQEVYDLIAEVGDNPKAKAVILWLDTPGGSAVGGEEMYLKLRELSTKKPVVAVMRSVAASAGYMIALGADYIVAREGTITGSIGVVMETAELTEMAEKLGIKPLVIKSAPLKAVPSPFEKTTPEAERVIQELIMDFYNRFVDIVAIRRHLPRDKVVSLADGRVYSGKRAVENKLVDAIGGEDEALLWLQLQKNIGTDVEIKDVAIEEPQDWMAMLTQHISTKFFPSSRLSLDGLAAIWHPQLH
jgi:protease-4